MKQPIEWPPAGEPEDITRTLVQWRVNDIESSLRESYNTWQRRQRRLGWFLRRPKWQRGLLGGKLTLWVLFGLTILAERAFWNMRLNERS